MEKVAVVVWLLQSLDYRLHARGSVRRLARKYILSQTFRASQVSN
jgi:hypothetical protein